MIQQSHSCAYIQKKKNENLIPKDTCTPILIAAPLQQPSHRNSQVPINTLLA